MFKIFTKILAVTLVLSASTAMAQGGGNGSGNPKNDDFYKNKPNPTPIMIWKDGHLIKNPAYFDKDSPYMKK